MGRTRTWLAWTDDDRQRLFENEVAVTKGRKLSILSVIVVLPFFAGAYGWWILAVAGTYFGYSRIADRMYRTSEHPERWLFSVTIVTQAMFALAAVPTGGPQSPALFWLVIALFPMPSRYGNRGMVVGGLFTLACLLLAAFSQGADQFLAHAEMTAVTISTGLSALLYGASMRHTEVAQRRAAILDPLTGLLNRTKLEDRFEEVQQLAARSGRSVALLVGDLDHFKTVNDEHGHAGGDAVLVGTAYELRRILDGHELIYRLGGEEFAVVLPGLGLQAATAAADSIRAAIADARPGGVAITISIGVAAADAEDLTYAALFAAADAALYDAKGRGRNRVVAVELVDGEARENGLGRRPLRASDDARAA